MKFNTLNDEFSPVLNGRLNEIGESIEIMLYHCSEYENDKFFFDR